MTKVFLSLGSNIGDKKAYLESALNKLNQLPKTQVTSADVVIAQWIGYDSTDENHYLTDASSGTASTIFSAVASSILPYTAGTEFTVENAYSQNGYDLVYSADGQASTSQSSSSDDILDKVQDSAQDVGEKIGQAVKDAWDSFSNWFSQQTN